MSSEGNKYSAHALDYGASVAGGTVDFAEDSNLESPGGRDKALIDKLKDALRPGDAKKMSTDTTHDGRHGGVEEVMQPGHRDYDESAHHGGILDQVRSGQPQGTGGGLIDSVKRKVEAGRNEMHRNSTDVNKSDESKVPGNM
ncbi:hypothetical protein F5Y07DRAFT_263922 [Xylaria sp. FL0933]|nr:hypothetical protein F5Y07DRAFT_263922 [Xylaria sp. FL0933]